MRQRQRRVRRARERGELMGCGAEGEAGKHGDFAGRALGELGMCV